MASGALFSDYFLSDGIALSRDWNLDQQDLGPAKSLIAELIADFDERHQPNEANTESDLIEKLLDLLGWNDRLKQEKANDRGRTDVPDYLLFLGPAEKAEAARAGSAASRYASGAAILEAKAWDVPLDKAEAGQAGAPSTQILRYLGTVDVQSEGAIRFGILTNGRLWRLYDRNARSRLEGFVEIDLTEAAGLIVPATGAADDHAEQTLRRFLFLFGRNAFEPDVGGATRLTRAIADSRSFEARVTDELARVVFDDVFPDLANALAAADPERPTNLTNGYLAEVREAALTWLYRLLFVLYAEDRSLLPTRARRDGLWAMRKEIARAIDGTVALSDRRTNHDRDLRDLWRQIDEGDESIGLPPYNGGLFRPGRSALLDRTLLPDSEFAPLLDALSRERLQTNPRFINYRDLNVQHLGSVYERLLDFDLTEDGGAISVRPQTFARKTSGSYYTPEELVMLVIRRTVGPLLAEREQAFAKAAEDESKSAQAREAPEYPLARLRAHDPASAFLELRICDPAMGSGHFLVSLVDYLADRTMLATEEAAAEVEFGDYRSPLLDRLEAIRSRIREQAEEHGWRVDDAQLIDRQLVRRIILKRVIHGVDKNPMAVELAKLSLWLHTFTVGAPLSFLDHHLRCGDSLFGEWVGPAMSRLEQGGLFVTDDLKAAQHSITEMATVEDLTDADIAEVKQSEHAFRSLEEQTGELSRKLSLLQGYRWIEDSTESALKRAKTLERESNRTNDSKLALELQRQAWNMKRKGSALDVLLSGQLGELNSVLDFFYGRVGELPPKTKPDDPALEPLAAAADIARTSNFLNWELAFPNVWRDWRSAEPKGGFDAVIGNPPWDRLKMQEVEWFAARKPEIAFATRAADRKAMIARLRADGEPLAEEYERASRFAAMAARMANLSPEKGGQYPLLGGGDVNLYSLFVERAQRLVKPDGLVGLVTPVGLTTDLGFAPFFGSLMANRRISTINVFENRGGWLFKDIHHEEKPTVSVVAGSGRSFEETDCAFFIRSWGEFRDPERHFLLSAKHFGSVNPNTGTAPLFRNRRDAEIVSGIYAKFPIIESTATRPARKAWPIHYRRMFDMTTQSHLFLNEDDLEREGFYPVANMRWKRGEEVFVPLFEGKMTQLYNHRYASVAFNPENLSGQGVTRPTSSENLENPNYVTKPRWWISIDLDRWIGARQWAIAMNDVANVNNERTGIFCLVPKIQAGNKLPILFGSDDLPHDLYSCLCGNLASIVFDFFVRQKMQARNLNKYILSQLPVIPRDGYQRNFGRMTAREIVAREVLRLTYTAHDMAAFARDMGHVDAAGEVLPPFTWDEADRRQRRARLDALYFHLYGLSREDANYILSTFPIVRRHDEAEHGRFLTRDLILHQMDALAAGDTDAIISLN